MCWWIVGAWWPGLLVMAAFMVICMLMMGGMMRSMPGMSSLGRRRSSWSGANVAEQAVKDVPGRGAVDARDHSYAEQASAPQQ